MCRAWTGQGVVMKSWSTTSPRTEKTSKSSPGRQKLRSGASKARNRGYDLSRRNVSYSPLHLTSNWCQIGLLNLKEDILSGDQHLSYLERKLEVLHRTVKEPSEKLSKDVIKRSRDGLRRVVKTSVTEPSTKGDSTKKSSTGKDKNGRVSKKDSRVSKGKKDSKGRVKSVKEEILNNPALDAQVESILSFIQQDNNY